ncbi:MAG TPA: IPT/TIG domain-containing protein, partial [Bacteroides reticulotermitis]|nr:IPT/TIG domain-containing protein [Bacteroides reticulotermitis]
MKHLLKNTFALHLLAMVTSMLIVGCEQDPQIKKYVYPMPEVSGMTPSIGYVTSQVVITGTNFGDRTESVKVLFGGVQATKVLMCKNNRIAVEVPENAVSGDVTLQVWTNEVGVIGQYTVLPTPHIQAVVSDNESGAGVAEPGDKVTILGENFGTDASLISVDFNGTPATDIALIDEKTIEATTPVGYASG